MQIIEDSSCWHNVGQCPDLEITVFFTHHRIHSFTVSTLSPTPLIIDGGLTMLSSLSLKKNFPFDRRDN